MFTVENTPFEPVGPVTLEAAPVGPVGPVAPTTDEISKFQTVPFHFQV
jgi:hypothetical protein